MKVALFGGTGYIGGYITDALIAHGHRPVLLVRPGSEGKILQHEQCELVAGGIGDESTIGAVLSDSQAVVYCIGIIRENPKAGITFNELHYQGVRRTVDMATRLGVRRFLLISALGARADGTDYQRTKYMGEEYLKRSRLDWTILQPSLAFGNPRGAVDFCSELRDKIVRLPLPAPLFYCGITPRNPGMFAFSPVYIGDIAEVAARAIPDRGSVGKTWRLCGPDRITWKTLIRIIAGVTGKRKLTVPVPAGAVMAVTKLLEGFSGYPVTRGQLQMLLNGNACDGSETFLHFGIDPVRFFPENLAYLHNK